MIDERETVRLYFRRPDGAVTEVTTTRPENVIPPEGAVQITAEEYEAALSALREANEAYLAEQREADKARTLADYRVLRGLGVPHDSALRMSGYDVDLFGPIEEE
jgi:hypothetical protein